MISPNIPRLLHWPAISPRGSERSRDRGCTTKAPGIAMSEFSSMTDLLRRRSAEQAGERAYVFLSERGGEEAALTFADLERRASAVAAQLAVRSQKGDRAL